MSAHPEKPLEKQSQDIDQLDASIDALIEEESPYITLKNEQRAAYLRALLKQESDSYVSLGEGMGDLSDGLSNLPHQPVSGDFISGVHVFSALLALYGFIRALVTFNTEALSLSTTARLFYVALILILLILAYLSPVGLAMALTVTLAALAVTESLIRLGKFIHTAYLVWTRSKAYELEKQALELAMQRDVDTLNALDLSRETSKIELENINQAIHVRKEALLQLSMRRMSLAEDKAKLTRAAFFRAYSMLIVAVSLTAAILAYFLPVVAGGLAILAFSLGGLWLGYAIVTYVKRLYDEHKEGASPAHTVSDPAPDPAHPSPTASVQVEQRNSTSMAPPTPVEELVIHDPTARLGGRHEAPETAPLEAVEPSPLQARHAHPIPEPEPTPLIEEDDEGEGEREKGPRPPS